MATMAVTTTIHEIEEHDGDLAEEIDLDDTQPPVHFYPPLYLQRRIWILDILRRENIVDVLDVGCGEGQLLSVLAQPAPWLAPPLVSIFPQNDARNSDAVELSYRSDMPNLHPRRIAGLDISASDLAFAVKETQPPGDTASEDIDNPYTVHVTRWEDLNAKVWKGGLEVVNEGFVGVECIVCTEVIEHLPPDILPALAPMLLGIYQPQRLLITTPSFTFNTRFTRPGAPRSVRLRQGYADPTGRTDRVFRHHDHKFEWTPEEFEVWCREASEQWGYDIEELGGVGRPLEDDPWGRDDALGNASLVVSFCRKEDGQAAERAGKARAVLEGLALGGEPHELLAEHLHKAHEMSRRAPTTDSVKDIGDLVKAKMEGCREAIIPLEQIWFERDVGVLCGGWIEVLIWAVEAYDGLNVLKANDGSKEWSIELVGGVKEPVSFWNNEAETSVDLIPHDWIPGKDPGDSEQSDEDVPSTVSSTGADSDGDVSWDGSEIGDDTTWSKEGWATSEEREQGWGGCEQEAGQG